MRSHLTELRLHKLTRVTQAALACMSTFEFTNSALPFVHDNSHIYAVANCSRGKKPRKLLTGGEKLRRSLTNRREDSDFYCHVVQCPRKYVLQPIAKFTLLTSHGDVTVLFLIDFENYAKNFGPIFSIKNFFLLKSLKSRKNPKILAFLAFAGISYQSW